MIRIEFRLFENAKPAYKGCSSVREGGEEIWLRLRQLGPASVMGTLRRHRQRPDRRRVIAV